jgi:aminomethyltransferase
VLDDLFTYRHGDGFLTVTNAANHERDLAWMRRQARGYDVTVHDRLRDYAMLAVQGPRARELMRGLVDGELPQRFRTARLNVAGAPGTLVCGTGYTGEDGVELLIAPGYATTIWDAVLEAGATPAGLGARDTLRLEVCFHLYGNDLSEDRNPIEAGLGWCCKLDTGFIGADALRGFEPTQRLAPFAFTGPGIPRPDNAVAAPHGAGVVTSGSLSPCLEVGIGMAYVPVEDAAPGTPIEVDVRGKTRGAEVREKPLYERRQPARTQPQAAGSAGSARTKSQR